MSEWHKVEDQEDVKLSEDQETIEVWFKGTDQGNVYVEIPVEFLTEELKKVKSE